MPTDHQTARAAAFRKLHDRSRILVLPNAWDAASARVFEDSGFPAVATTSAGVAFALGYPDGERAARDEVVEAVARICRAVRVPVSADMEQGFGRDPSEVAKTIRAVLDAGAIGVNLEDSTGDPRRPLRDVVEQVERLRAAREAASPAGVHLVINARTDVYLASVGEPSGRFADTVRRTLAYRQAGADCLFVPGVTDRATIAALVKEVGGPLNVLAGSGTPAVPELEALGVARVSLGSGPARAALTLTRRIAQELTGPGTFTLFTQNVISYADLNRLMARDANVPR